MFSQNVSSSQLYSPLVLFCLYCIKSQFKNELETVSLRNVTHDFNSYSICSRASEVTLPSLCKHTVYISYVLGKV
jgi:hypothetical protein